jgi:hypothetical protein
MQMAGSNNASRYIDGKYAININSGVTINNTKYPPDLAELVMDLKVENEILTGAWAHLDIDVYTNNQELKPYEHDSVIETLNDLRARAKAVYNSIIRDSN